MKALFPILLIVGVAQNAPVLAQSSTATASASSPLLGSWAVDVSRLSLPPEARPKSVTMTFSDAGAGRWRTNVDIIAGDGSESHAVSTYALDGTVAPITGSPGLDTAAVKTPASNVMVLALANGGVPASTRVYSVAPDGNMMTETAVYFGNDGKPVMRTSYFNRTR